MSTPIDGAKAWHAEVTVGNLKRKYWWALGCHCQKCKDTMKAAWMLWKESQ